jgi:hypothetical protein
VRTCYICRFAQKANHLLMRGALREHGNTDGLAWGVSANARSQPDHERSESMRRSGKISSISVTVSEVRVSRARWREVYHFEPSQTLQADEEVFEAKVG